MFDGLPNTYYETKTKKMTIKQMSDIKIKARDMGTTKKNACNKVRLNHCVWI